MTRVCVKLTSGDTLDFEMSAQEIDSACAASGLVELRTADGLPVFVSPAQIVSGRAAALETRKPRGAAGHSEVPLRGFEH